MVSAAGTAAQPAAGVGLSMRSGTVTGPATARGCLRCKHRRPSWRVGAAADGPGGRGGRGGRGGPPAHSQGGIESNKWARGAAVSSNAGGGQWTSQVPASAILHKADSRCALGRLCAGGVRRLQLWQAVSASANLLEASSSKTWLRQWPPGSCMYPAQALPAPAPAMHAPLAWQQLPLSAQTAELSDLRVLSLSRLCGRRYERNQYKTEDPEEEQRQRNFKSLLNKITPEKFDVIKGQIVAVGIAESRTLIGLIDQVRCQVLSGPWSIQRSQPLFLDPTASVPPAQGAAAGSSSDVPCPCADLAGMHLRLLHVAGPVRRHKAVACWPAHTGS